MLPALAIIGTGLALSYSSGPRNTVNVQYGGRMYKMQNLPDRTQAVILMDKIRQNLEKVVEELRHETEPCYKRLVERFNPDALQENDVDADSTSYSENKGQKIVVCLRSKQPPYPLVDENTVMFVLLHEMAHLMTESMGHTPEFWTNFRKLLHDSVKIGVYTPVNYTKSPVEYCGMNINDTPL